MVCYSFHPSNVKPYNVSSSLGVENVKPECFVFHCYLDRMYQRVHAKRLTNWHISVKSVPHECRIISSPFQDICQDKGRVKTDISWWGALIYAGTPGDSKRCQSLLPSHGGIFFGTPPRYVRFPVKRWGPYLQVGQWGFNMGKLKCFQIPCPLVYYKNRSLHTIYCMVSKARIPNYNEL